jgi:hypothetical protein
MDIVISSANTPENRGIISFSAIDYTAKITSIAFVAIVTVGMAFAALEANDPIFFTAVLWVGAISLHLLIRSLFINDADSSRAPIFSSSPKHRVFYRPSERFIQSVCKKKLDANFHAPVGISIREDLGSSFKRKRLDAEPHAPVGLNPRRVGGELHALVGGFSCEKKHLQYRGKTSKFLNKEAHVKVGQR